jgi:hypothetical protein
VRSYGAGFHPDAPVFRNTAGSPYRTIELLSRAFSRLRESVFPGDARTLMDMRTTGTVEATAGGAAVEDVAAKMANNIDHSAGLQATYMPVNEASVARHDRARIAGRSALRKDEEETITDSENDPFTGLLVGPECLKRA